MSVCCMNTLTQGSYLVRELGGKLGFKKNQGAIPSTRLGLSHA